MTYRCEGCGEEIEEDETVTVMSKGNWLEGLWHSLWHEGHEGRVYLDICGPVVRVEGDEEMERE